MKKPEKQHGGLDTHPRWVLFRKLGKIKFEKKGKLNSKKENNPVLMHIKNMIRYHYTLTTKTNLKKTIPSPNKDVEQLEL